MSHQRVSLRHCQHTAIGWSVCSALSLLAGAASAQVSTSGNVSIPIAPAAVVDLTGQQLFIGQTGGTTGSLTVTNGGILSAAQVVAGTGVSGSGVVNVNGPNSRINLTGGAAFNGLDIGSWGTGVATVSNGGSIVCSSPLACGFSSLGNGAGSSGSLTIDNGQVLGLGGLSVGNGFVQASPAFGTVGGATSGTLRVLNGGALGTTTGSIGVANSSNPVGPVTGTATIRRSFWRRLKRSPKRDSGPMQYLGDDAQRGSGDPPLPGQRTPAPP